MNVQGLKDNKSLNGTMEVLEEGEYALQEISPSLEELNPVSQFGAQNMNESLALLGFPQGSSDKEDDEGWSQTTMKSKKKKKPDVGGGQ